MQSATDAPRPRGRVAHSGRLNRVGQSWKQDTVLACVCDEGSRFYRKIIKVDTDNHFTCPECGAVVDYDEHEYACCECRIWNEKSEIMKKRLEILTGSKIGRFFNRCSY